VEEGGHKHWTADQTRPRERPEFHPQLRVHVLLGGGDPTQSLHGRQTGLRKVFGQQYHPQVGRVQAPQMGGGGRCHPQALADQPLLVQAQEPLVDQTLQRNRAQERHEDGRQVRPQQARQVQIFE